MIAAVDDPRAFCRLEDNNLTVPFPLVERLAEIVETAIERRDIDGH
jgi:hypothetical protein